MKKKKSILRSFQFLACLLFMSQVYPAYGSEAEQFPVGSQIAPFTVGVPGSPEVQNYLGLKSNDPFKLSNISAKIVVIEFMNAMWPECIKNAPVVNRLYSVIQGDTALAKDIKVIGIAIGNNQKEVDAFKTQFKTAFPIFPDKEGTIYFAVGKPGTPTMVVTTPGGKVLMSHGGVIKDFDGLLKELREILKKQ